MRPLFYFLIYLALACAGTLGWVAFFRINRRDDADQEQHEQ